ncbi:MAG: nucleotidyltransferase domain-containing protein [Candidatus Nealsonbacteria bacterium]|nr:nucleotidyltransferase domain-containing protein [Candidatus Nealsonbacteria bacterium]
MRKNINKKFLIGKIAKKYSLELILLFGSQVESKTHPNSDLDIAILPKTNRDYNWDRYSSLISDFSKAFSVKKIDLVFINEANPLLLKKICDNTLLVFGNQKTFTELRLKAFKYFQDYLPYFKLEEAAIHQYLK